MIEFSISKVHAGWLLATISDGSVELPLSVSYVLDDAIRDFIDAVQSLGTASNADCRWFQEPGELQWKLHREGKRLTIQILEFPGGTLVFQGSTDWRRFALRLKNSMEDLRVRMTEAGYEQAWGHPFPSEACAKLANAIVSRKRPAESDGTNATQAGARRIVPHNKLF